jgi:hypothetical protein
MAAPPMVREPLPRAAQVRPATYHPYAAGVFIRAGFPSYGWDPRCPVSCAALHGGGKPAGPSRSARQGRPDSQLGDSKGDDDSL